jgi:uncharacterized SAM-binding protein YcdF (DUF218 family)
MPHPAHAPLDAPLDAPVDAPVDAVVVLGAAMAAPGVPGPALVRRLEHGVRVLTARGAGYLVVSGGVVGPPPAEAQMMGELARARGVAASRILVEDQARNTFENAVFSGRIIRAHGWSRVIVVTDAFHLRRALFVFRRIGLAVSGDGVPRPPQMTRIAWARLHLEEQVRLANSALLFLRGAHRPLLARTWGDTPEVHGAAAPRPAARSAETPAGSPGLR